MRLRSTHRRSRCDGLNFLIGMAAVELRQPLAVAAALDPGLHQALRVAVHFRARDAPQEQYDIIVRGKLGPDAAIGRPLLRRIASADVGDHVERLVETWIRDRTDGEGLPEFYRRLPDEAIVAIAGGAPIPEPRPVA